MTKIVKVKLDNEHVYPQTHAAAVEGLETIQGPKGDTGATGAAGSSATITIGTVTTGAAGSSATVVNAGTASAAKFNFTIPAGAKGDKGDTGATGPQGATGAAGTNATTTAVATATVNGLMAAADKKKLDGLPAISYEVVGEV